MPFRPHPFSIIACAALSAPAFAQTYSLTATARASGEPDVVETTTTGTSVAAANASVGFEPNPAFVNSSAAGTPSSGVASVDVSAQTTGPNAGGGGQGDLFLGTDEIYFASSSPFVATVSLSASASLVVSSVGGSTRTDISANVQRVRPSGAAAGSGSWNYIVQNDSTNGYRVSFDRRDPITFQMEPGDFIRISSLRVRAAASASASIVNPNGSANAAASASVFITAAGDAAISGSLSGDTYGPPPCPADFNADGAANVLDVVDFITTWNALGAGADVNEDGAVNVLDVVNFITTWSAGCP